MKLAANIIAAVTKTQAATVSAALSAFSENSLYSIDVDLSAHQLKAEPNTHKAQYMPRIIIINSIT